MKHLMIRALAVVLFALACGKAADKNFKGPPLATLSGALSSDGLTSIPNGAALAVLWYTYPNGSTGPTGFVVSEATYHSESSSRFKFDVLSPPPDAALLPAPGGGHVASGVVVAYVDKNGNGKLDPIPVGGRPVDQLVAVSTRGSDEFGVFDQVAYADSDLSVPGWYSSAPISLNKGFNLVEVNGTTNIESIVASLTLYVEQKAVNNLLVCESDTTGKADTGSACMCDVPNKLYVSVQASGHTSSGVPGFGTLSGSVKDCNGMAPDVSVALNGIGVPYDRTKGNFSVSQNTGNQPLFKVGQNTLDVFGNNIFLESVPFTMPSVAILSPADGGTVPAGQPFAVTWSAQGNPGQFDLGAVGTGISTAQFRFDVNTTDKFGVIPAPPSGPFSVSVGTYNHPVVLPSGDILNVGYEDSINLRGVP